MYEPPAYAVHLSAKGGQTPSGERWAAVTLLVAFRTMKGAFEGGNYASIEFFSS